MRSADSLSSGSWWGLANGKHRQQVGQRERCASRYFLLLLPWRVPMHTIESCFSEPWSPLLAESSGLSVVLAAGCFTVPASP